MASPAKARSAKRQVACTLSVGQTVASEVNLPFDSLVGIHLPANLTGTALTFSAATAKGGTFNSVVDTANAAISFTVPAGAGRYISFTQDQIARFAGIENFKITSNAAQLTADAVFALVTRPVL